MTYSVIASPTSYSGSQTGSWDNLGNVLAEDGASAVSQRTAQNTIVPYLKLSKFGMAIPSEATITGVAMHVTGRNELSLSYGFQLLHSGLRLLNVVGSSASMVALQGNQMQTKIVGGDGFMWNVAEITSEQVNSDLFGVYLSFRNISTTTQKLLLDNVKLEVFYTLPEGSPEPFTGGGTLPPKNP